MEYLIRFVQVHESFRKPEVEALAALANVDVEFLDYSECSPFCALRLPNEAAARALMSRSILSKGIYELWGSGATYEELHDKIRSRTSSQWAQYSSCSFRFDFDTYQVTRSVLEQTEIIESCSYLGFNGRIQMKDPEQIFRIFENYDHGTRAPKRIYFGRWIAASQRHTINNYSLKKRNYISTTSMDSELALLTANISLAGPGKVFYDPFVGTGSFPIACSHFGAITMGSDIDSRMVRGKDGLDIRTSFRQYGLADKYLDGFISDLTHSPLKTGRFLDGIVCDPPYGVREGLRVLGTRDGGGKEVHLIDGKPAYLHDNYLYPKRPYSFEAMLADLLEFATTHLVDDGRLSFWMPTANDEDVYLAIPTHSSLELVSVCVQSFNKWSRRLLTYRRLPDNTNSITEPVIPVISREIDTKGHTVNDLNSFRKRYFQGFKTSSPDQFVPDETVPNSEPMRTHP
ncbi:hypothetical protein MMC22_009110 [Lobaria immixta]|nr:hypothetical protein [Lobaria immixta]